MFPTPSQLKKILPTTKKGQKFISNARETIKNILNSKDNRKIFIVGPCSIHDFDSAIEYAKKFKNLSQEVSKKILMIMRVYVEKSRTSVGWSGLLHDPYLDGSCAILDGLKITRKLFSHITDMDIPIACELLGINTSYYFSDFLSWGCIGARTSTSHPHRQLASNLPFAVGIKNSPDGNISNAVHGAKFASFAHSFLGIGNNGKVGIVKSRGNPDCHIVLRGGYFGPNYDIQYLVHAKQACQRANVCDKLIVDCSHDNSDKRADKQKEVATRVLNTMVQSNSNVVGVMLESNLFSGSQPFSSNPSSGISITDQCLDWEETEELIKTSANKLP